MDGTQNKHFRHFIILVLINPLGWVASFIVSRILNLDWDKSVLAAGCVAALILLGYTVFRFKKAEISERRDFVLANLILDVMLFLYFLRVFRIDPQMDILAGALRFAAGILFCIPPLISIPFLLLILLGKPINRKLRIIESPLDSERLNKFAAKFFALLGLIISLTSMAAAIMVFGVGFTRFPLSLYFVAPAIYCSYWACLGSVLDLRGHVSSKSLFFQALLDVYAALAREPEK